MAVVVQSVDRSQQPQLLRPQEVRTVEVPWYEDQVGSCAFSVPVACLAGIERGREGEFGHQYKAEESVQNVVSSGFALASELSFSLLFLCLPCRF